ncbi:unnamed protein product [Cuscuta campestris]|uniref:Transposase, Ptta/En/Spm, plant n=1 Tax=Cuscuta campestris TaxID=132261 RepID=A0A484K9I3_9ASTE|nr:unnamed protein product [Cuscuta campestris]
MAKTSFTETGFQSQNEVHVSADIGHVESDEEVTLQTPTIVGKYGKNFNTEAQIGDEECHIQERETNVQKKVKGRGNNKRKVLDKSVFVELNEDNVPVSDSQRQMSSLIGTLVRDPRKLPLDCFDWRKMEEAKKELIWTEVKRSYNFPEGKEPREWVIMKAHASWKDYKSELKEKYFNGKTLAIALQNRPQHIPPNMWTNLVEFWSSDLGKKRSEIGIKNRGKNRVPHYSGTRSHARVRANEEAKGNKIDKLGTWLLTHEPKKGSKLDDISAMKKELILKKLDTLKDIEVGAPACDEVFEKIVGEDKNGYAKTFGMGIRVPRSCTKRCALKEEKAKRLKIEQEHEATKERLQNLEDVVALLLNSMGSKANQSEINDLMTDGNTTTEKSHDEDRWNKDDEAENDELEDLYRDEH